MNLLPDTSALIMLVQGRPIPDSERLAIENTANLVFVSLVLPWEMQIKFDINKLELQQPVREIIDAQFTHGSFTLLAITLDHIDGLSRRPFTRA